MTQNIGRLFYLELWFSRLIRVFEVLEQCLFQSIVMASVEIVLRNCCER